LKPDEHRRYEKLNREQLCHAEATACQFLEENSSQIGDTMRAKIKFLEILVQRISLKQTRFEDRLEFLARISEIAQLIQDDANGFFALASQPAVARLLGTVKRKQE
jgi:hypothetical protein